MMQEKIKIDPYLLTAIVRYLSRLPTSVQDLYPMKRLLCGESRSPLGGYLESQGVPNFLTLERGAWEPVRWMGKLRTFEVHRYLVNDYSFLKECKNLESISVMPPQRQAFDCTLLQEIPWLHRAELLGFDLLHPEKLVDPQPLTFPVRYDPPALFPMLEGLPAAICPEEKTPPTVPDGLTGNCLLCWNKRAKSWKGYLCKNGAQIEQVLLYFCQTGEPFPGVSWAVPGDPPKI